MTFEFGVFLEFPRYPAQSDAEAFAQSFAQADAAERLGFDAVWLAELHFAPDRSIASAPLVLASAIAARTRRMKIGIAVQVLPLCHPLRLAEEVATLDHISEGRLILGVGRSGIPRSYEAYGIPYSESRERFAEVLEILQRSCRKERFALLSSVKGSQHCRGFAAEPDGSLSGQSRGVRASPSGAFGAFTPKTNKATGAPSCGRGKLLPTPGRSWSSNLGDGSNVAVAASSAGPLQPCG